MPRAPWAALPAGWVEEVSRRSGAPYFFNTETGETTYERPSRGFDSSGEAGRGSSESAEVAALPPAAKRARSEPSAPPLPPPPPQAAGGERQAALAVAAAYDSYVDRGVLGRRESAILHLKNLNNWVKAVLIAEYAPKPSLRVLDLACGKLGDLQKWRLAGVQSYCGVDISATGIADGRGRFNSLGGGGGARGGGGGGGIAAKLVHADLGVTNLRAAGVLRPDERFDCVSIQFALHYLFASERRALAFFRNVADALAPGGVFLGTLPDAAHLVRRLRDAPPLPHGGGARRFGNAIYSIAADAAAVARQFALGDDPYGLPYTFFLTECVESVTEYLVPWPLLLRLAAAAGLEPLAADNFHAFYARMAAEPRHAETLRAMRVMDCEGTLSAAEWEAAGIYRVFAFRRVRSEAEVAASGQPTLPSVEALFPGGVPRAADPRAADYHAALEPHHIVSLL